MKLRFILILLPFFISCKPDKQLGDGIFDLNDFSFSINAAHLYEKPLKGQITDNYFSQVDTSFNTAEGDYHKSVVGIHYIMNINKEIDTIGKLKNVYFFKVESVTDAKQNLMMVSAEGNADFRQQLSLIKQLLVEYGKPKVIQHISGFTTFTWRLSDRIIQINAEMIPDYENDKNAKEGFLNPNGGFLKTDHYEKDHVAKIFAYIFNIDHEELLGKYAGQWQISNDYSTPYLNDANKTVASPFN